MGRPAPCPRVTPITDQLCVGGLGGGLAPEAIGVLLQEHSVTHVVVCGHRGADAHVAATEAAAKACGAEVHVAPLVPADTTQLPSIIEEAAAFVEEGLSDDLSCVLVACSKGASRSVAVVLAHSMAFRGLSLQDAFNRVAQQRWQIWPSALLVEALFGFEIRHSQGRGHELPSVPDQAAVGRHIGVHAAWATAWHNGREAELSAARAAWDASLAEGGSLEEVFRTCKQRLLGLTSACMAAFDAPHQVPGSCQCCPPHAEMCEVVEGLLLCGLGGLPTEAVARMLRSHNVVKAVICGRPERDRHVSTSVSAMESLTGDTSSVLVVPIADSASEDLLSHLEATSDYLRDALTTRGPGKVVVACRQGASRSAAVVVAYLMRSQGATVSESFQAVAAKRWRVWPNAGFAEQLLRLEDSLRVQQSRAPLTEAERRATLRLIGVHAAWAANRQNLEESGVGRPGITLADVEKYWNEAVESSPQLDEQFERCKALTLGVDLSAFDEGKSNETCDPDASRTKRARTNLL